MLTSLIERVLVGVLIGTLIGMFAMLAATVGVKILSFLDDNPIIIVPIILAIFVRIVLC